VKLKDILTESRDKVKLKTGDKVKLTKAQKQVVGVMEENSVMTLDELMEKTGKKWGSLTKILASLIKAGIIDKPNAYRNEYVLNKGQL